MKPRILILMHYMELGGAEMSLLGLLDALEPERVDVDLFIYSHQGPLMQFIPAWINLLPEIPAYSVIERPLKETIRKGYIKVALGRLLAKVKHRQYRRKHPTSASDASIFQYVGDCVTPCLPAINPDVEYDLCISYLNPHNIGLEKVRAKKRLAWIHTDYKAISINADDELRIWGAYDNIASISADVRKSFLEIFPSLSGKIIDIENILPANYIRKRVEELEVPVSDKSVTLLSIGRFCEAKNYDNVPDIARRIINHGISNLKWYLIGYGGDEALIRAKIREAGMEEHVIILGKRDNPYPYIKACDIYVQPSRYEGKSITVREAQILGKPVVVTAYKTASSQINDGLDGVIVPLDNEGCARGLADFIADAELRAAIAANITTADHAATAEVAKIYSLIEE